MENADAAGRHAEADEHRRVGVQHADVVDAVAPHAVGGVAEELARVLDPKEVRLGLQAGLLREERALAGTELELEGPLRVRVPRAHVDVPGLGVRRNLVGQRRQIVVDDAVRRDVLRLAA